MEKNKEVELFNKVVEFEKTLQDEGYSRGEVFGSFMYMAITLARSVYIPKREFMDVVDMIYDTTPHKEENDAQEFWNNNTLQFSRLITEIFACSDSIDLKTISNSMDLSIEDVIELKNRANTVFEAYKKILKAND